MSEPVMSASEMLAWNEKTSSDWMAFIGKNPEILALPCDIYHVKTVGELLRHIVAVELRYGQRLSGVEETPYNELPYCSAEEIYASHDRAMALVRAALANPGYDWQHEQTFNTISAGRLRATRAAMLFHMLLHTARHYAQLATLVRQHGFAPGFPMDYLMLVAQPA